MRFFGLSHLLASSLVILSTIPALVNALPTNDLESRQSTIPLGPGTIHVVSDSNTTTYGCLDRNGRFILEGNKLSCGMFVPTGATDGAAWLKSSSGTCYFNKESSYNYQCKHVNQNVAADSLFAVGDGCCLKCILKASCSHLSRA